MNALTLAGILLIVAGALGLGLWRAVPAWVRKDGVGSTREGKPAAWAFLLLALGLGCIRGPGG
jgi:hypothetical protein